MTELPQWTITVLIALFIICTMTVIITLVLYNNQKEYIFEKTQFFNMEQSRYAAEITLLKAANGHLDEDLQDAQRTAEERWLAMVRFDSLLLDITTERDALVEILKPYAEHYGASFGNIERPIEETMDKVRKVFGANQDLVTIAMMAYGERRGEITSVETPVYAELVNPPMKLEKR